MTDQSDSLTEQLMAKNGRLQHQITVLHAQMQQLARYTNQLEAELNQLRNTVGQIDVVQVVSDAIMVTDTEFHIQSWNRAAETMYGWQEAEVQGQSLTALGLTPDLVPLV